MIDTITTIISTLVGAVVGGGLAVWGSIRAVRESAKDLELVEIRRQKVDCLATLTGLRFVTADGQPQLDEYRSRFMFEMNRIPMLWCDDTAVLKEMRDFYADRTNERFVKLFRSMGQTTKFPISNLSDADLRNVFLMVLSGGKRQ